jgi:hypothetical protein
LLLIICKNWSLREHVISFWELGWFLSNDRLLLSCSTDLIVLRDQVSCWLRW